MDDEGFTRKLWKYLPNFYNDDKFSDFEFVINGGMKMNGHKFILLLHCDDWNIDNFDSLSILDLSVMQDEGAKMNKASSTKATRHCYRRTTSEIFIRWIYTGAIKTIDKTILKELLEMSVSFNLSSLYDRCKVEMGSVDTNIVEMEKTPENFELDSRNIPLDQEDTEESNSNPLQDMQPEYCMMKPERKSHRVASSSKQSKPRSFTGRMQHCQLCEKNFTSQFRLTKHLHSFHKRKVEDCFMDTKVEADANKSVDVCGKLLNSEPDSERCNSQNSRSLKADAGDFRPIQSEESYSCDYCTESCTSKTDHEIHLKIFQTVSKFSCEFCLKVFLSEEKLKKHKASHTKVLKCDVCSKVFKTAQNLYRHLRVHTGEKPYLCSHCGQGFIQLTQLQIHLRGHSGERPYHCGHCLKTFASKFIYKQHLYTHAIGQKQYICDVCGQSFNRQSNCRRHIQLHNDSKPYKCNDCGKAYSTKHALKMHKHHSPSATSCQNYGETPPCPLPVSMATVAVPLSSSTSIMPPFISNTSIHVQTMPDK